MLYYLYEYLYPLGQEYKILKIFNVFQYVTFRSVMAVLTALIITFIISPKIIRYLREKKIGQCIRDDGPKTHLSKSGTPTMGGIIIIIAVFFSSLLWAKPDNIFLWVCLFSMISFGAIGFIDDYLKLIKKNPKGLAGRYKILGQFIFSAAIISVLYLHLPRTLYFPFFSDPILDLGIFFIPFGLIVLIGSSNSVNLTDGLDGLAIGLSLFVIATFGIFAYLTGHKIISDYLKIPFIAGTSEITVFLAALAGGGLGFLWYNSHPAEIFMGDTGSLFLGGTLGTTAVILKKEFLLLLVGGIFVAEALSVMIQVLVYKKTGKRVFKMAPLHHHFELKGWHESKVIIRFWIIGLMLSLLGLATLKLQ
ncbi:MAG: phospho-N-acetylmuramoyl-pentapeptide-transferase [Spirochaetes bacterium GWB1_36_13]|nr:MAG: phospho-N-acetylmuramoyl-pentapeptide-transferase [Spirochaetes bacterium GWB1_36_13]